MRSVAQSVEHVQKRALKGSIPKLSNTPHLLHSDLCTKGIKMQNQLININQNMTMSSLDIVKTINAIRKSEGNNTELRHSDFLEKVKQVLPHSAEFSAQYNDSTGRLLP